MDESKHKEAVEEEIKVYQKLKALRNSPEFQALLELMIKTASQKMVYAFTGDNVKSWEEYTKVRGEVTSYLYLIQEVGGAEAFEKHLQEQLKQYFGPQT